MRSTGATSIVYVGMAILSGLGATASCTLDSDGDPAAPTGTTDNTVSDGSTMTTTVSSTTSSTTGSGMSTTGSGVTSTTGSGVTSTTDSGTVTSTTGSVGLGGTMTGTEGTTGMGTTGMGTTGMGGMGGVGGGGSTDQGTMGTVGAGGVTSTTGTSTTGDTGACTKGQTKGDEVAVIGESFIALSHQITREIENRAKAAGSLASSESYIDKSVSGTTLANNQIGSQYTSAVQESSMTIKYVVMDGGGNDCLINNNGAAALTAVDQLFQTMADNGTEKIMYFFYPDPIGNNFASLKSCLDQLRPQMKERCDNLTAPKCYWLDLRDTWDGHPEYTSDGIHPTNEGAAATGQAVWDEMVKNCIAQ